MVLYVEYVNQELILINEYLNFVVEFVGIVLFYGQLIRKVNVYIDLMLYMEI